MYRLQGGRSKFSGHSTCVDFIDGNTAELGSALFAQLHMSIEEAMASQNPFIRGLALLDGRCGRRKVLVIAPEGQPSFVATMLAARLRAMDRTPCKVFCESCGVELPAATLLTGHSIGSPSAPAEFQR